MVSVNIRPGLFSERNFVFWGKVESIFVACWCLENNGCLELLRGLECQKQSERKWICWQKAKWSKPCAKCSLWHGFLICPIPSTSTPVDLVNGQQYVAVSIGCIISKCTFKMCIVIASSHILNSCNIISVSRKDSENFLANSNFELSVNLICKMLFQHVFPTSYTWWKAVVFEMNNI